MLVMADLTGLLPITLALLLVVFSPILYDRRNGQSFALAVLANLSLAVWAANFIWIIVIGVNRLFEPQLESQNRKWWMSFGIYVTTFSCGLLAILAPLGRLSSQSRFVFLIILSTIVQCLGTMSTIEAFLNNPSHGWLESYWSRFGRLLHIQAAVVASCYSGVIKWQEGPPPPLGIYPQHNLQQPNLQPRRDPPQPNPPRLQRWLTLLERTRPANDVLDVVNSVSLAMILQLISFP